MFFNRTWGRITAIALTAAALTAGTSLLPPRISPVAPAQAQSVDEFRIALESYGFWQNSPRWGEVWVPYEKPRDWRPYTVGHWVYTDEWGWYWVSDADEEDWGWITYHYGRWVRDAGLGWVWVPGEEWAPAWVNWRNGDDYVGWAPLPPDEVIYEYDEDPVYWTFIAPRYLFAPGIRRHYVYGGRGQGFFRRTVVVNRTMPLQGRRFAVNPGIAPNFIATRTHRAVPTYRVQPRVLGNTVGIAGAVATRPNEFHGRPGQRAPGRKPTVTVTRTTAVQPGKAAVSAPQALPRGERGRFGPRPPQAAKGATVAPVNTAPRRPPPARNVTPPPQQPAAQPRGVAPQSPPTLQRPPPQAAPKPQIQLQPAPQQTSPQINVSPPPAAKPAPVAKPTPPPAARQAPPPAARQAPPPAARRAPPPAAKPAPPAARRAPPPAAHRAPPPRKPPPAKKPPPKKPEQKN